MTFLPNTRTLLRAAVMMLLTSTCLLMAVTAYGQTPSTTRYTYDENGRLKTVILPNGDSATYNYDAAGNITSIERSSTNAVQIQDFSPKEGLEGDQVTLTGIGFDATPSNNTVKFNNNVTATIISATATQIVVEVPTGAITGNISITCPNGSASTSQPFTMVSQLRVMPEDADVAPTETIQFSTKFTSYTGDESVTWKVNGVTGGNSTVGTINTNGLYTAPAFTPTQAPFTVTIRATSTVNSSLYGEVTLNVGPKLIAIAPAKVSVLKGRTNLSGAKPVSVRYGIAAPSIAKPVSVYFGSPTGLVNNLVSVMFGPVITSFSTSSLTKNTTTTLTITGSNFTGVNNLRFFTSTNTNDSQITFSNLSVNGAGTEITVDVTVSSSAATGSRVVVVYNTTLGSQNINVGNNTISIVP